MKLAPIKEKIRKLIRQSLFKEVSWVFIGQLFNIFVQAPYFVIITRVLGPENYGSFMSVTALASLVFPFVALGTEDVLIQKVAVKPRLFSIYWGNCLFILLVNGFLLLIICLLISPIFFAKKISLITITLILIADLICLSSVEYSKKALMSVYLAKNCSQLSAFVNFCKLLAAVSLASFFKNPSIETWAILYGGTYLVLSILAITVVNRLIAFPRPKFSYLIPAIKQGLFFSIGTSADNINANLDKTMLATMGGLKATGIYASAYRFIDFGNIPIMSIFGASYTRFFKHGKSGIQNTLKFARKLLPILVGSSIICILGYHVFAPLIPYILGAKYQNAITALLWLSPLPAIFAFRLLAADSLTGAGYQKVRSIVQIISAILNIGLNIWLIPIYSWKGAAWATLISDTLQMLFLWIIVMFLSRKTALGNKSV